MSYIETTLMIPIISSTYGLKFERRILDRFLCVGDNSDIPGLLLQSVLLLLPMNWYNNRILPLIKQFSLTTNIFNEFMDLRT
jgi:hypothetical protein